MSVEISNLPELVAQLTTSDFTPVVHNGTTYKHKTGSYFVRKSEDETINGVKTFSSSPIVPNGDSSGEAVNYGQLSTLSSTVSTLSSTVSTLDSENVKLTGVQTISDVKTFSSSPIVPTPTTGTQAANKTYVDATISALGTTVEISANYTVTEGVSKIVVTTTNAVTITIPAGFALHSNLTINRNVASANAITVNRSGTETIEGATSFVIHGSHLSASSDGLQENTLSKVGASSWSFVNGIISGETSAGTYQLFPNGNVICDFCGVIGEKAVTTPWGSLYTSSDITWTYPYAGIVKIYRFSGAHVGNSSAWIVNTSPEIATTSFKYQLARSSSATITARVSLSVSGSWR